MKSDPIITMEDIAMKESARKRILVWILQTGEPLHIDNDKARPMRAINLSNALLKAGHRVVLWSSTFNHQEKRHRSKNEEKINVTNNLEIRLIPSRGYYQNIGLDRLFDHAQMATRLKTILTKEKEIPDVAFVGYPPIETAAVMTRWLNIHGVPTLLDVKDQWPTIFLNAFPKKMKLLAQLILLPYFHYAKRSMKDATGISSMANGFLNWAIEFIDRKPNKNDAVFPLTTPIGLVSDVELKNARQWWDKQGVKNDGHSRMCFVGSIMSVFDFKPIQEAAKNMIKGSNHCEFIICGEGGSSEKIRDMMANLPNVRFPGWINRPQIEALAERCYGALIPYLNTEDYRMSIPNKVIDAFSLGLPILTPLQGEVASLISQYGVGLRYGTDTGRTLHNCIQELIINQSLRKKMTKNARALYHEKFSFELVYGNLVKHLEKMARQSANN